MKKLAIIGLASVAVAGLGTMALSTNAFWGGKNLGNNQTAQEQNQVREQVGAKQKKCGGGCGVNQGQCNGSCQGSCSQAQSGSCGCGKAR